MGDWWKSAKADWWFKTSGAEKDILAGIGLYGLFKKSIDAENATVQRCPKCHHHTFYKLHPSEKKTPKDSNWLCSQCGNDTDEFGNQL
jgi:DNA-directed RNA polymerase subunit RPC12/RpoP